MCLIIRIIGLMTLFRETLIFPEMTQLSFRHILNLLTATFVDQTIQLEFARLQAFKRFLKSIFHTVI